MNQIDRFKETIAAYRRHGWQIRRVLMSKSTTDELTASGEHGIEGIVPELTLVDALWFRRPSHEGREAWELRLVGETPYALFEAFEKDCDADFREETLRAIELRLIEHTTES